MAAMRTSTLLCTLILAGCSTPAKPANELPKLTAVEEFHLQGECATLAEKLAKKNANYLKGIGMVPLDETPHYSRRDNRCYVQTSTPDELYHSTITMLWDGQTEEVFAFIEPAKTDGHLFGYISGLPTDPALDAACNKGADTPICEEATLNQARDYMVDKMNH
jgi:hypothetical protein